MTIVEMLRAEADNIEENFPNMECFVRNDVTDIMISVRFSDRTYHHILPGEPAMRFLVEDLLRILNNTSYKEKTLENFKNNRMPEFVDQGEFEL